MKNKKFYLFIGLVILVFSACVKSDNNVFANNKGGILQNEKLSAIKPEISQQAEHINSFGSITFIQKTDITAPADGIIEKIHIEEGDSIQEKELLVSIKNVQLLIQKKKAETAIESGNAQLMLATTRLEEGKRQMESRFLGLSKSKLKIQQKALEVQNARQMFKRRKELFEIDGASETEIDEFELSLKSIETEYKTLLTDYEISRIGFRDKDLLETYGIVPENKDERRKQLINLNTRTLVAELDAAKAGLSSNKSELASINLLLDEMSIKALYNGIVGAKYLEEGERVKSGDKILTTFKSGEVYAVFPVQESQSLKVYKDMTVFVTVPSISKPAFEAKISHVSPTVDPQSGNLTVKARIEDFYNNLKPGMFFTVEIITDEYSEKLLVPVSCVFDLNENSAEVFVIKNNRVFSKNIEVGETFSDKISVNSGISSEDIVVDQPPAVLRDGMEVDYEIFK